MGSTFSGFSISKSGLFAQQRALNVISHNIANANTEGYSRQRVDLQAYRPERLPGEYGMLGTGVDTTYVKQFRDEFLDFKYRSENTASGNWTFKEEALSIIETIFNEPSDSGIRSIMDDFFGAVQELNKNPESLTTRSLVRQRSIALAENIKNMHSTLERLQSDIDFQLEAVVNEINGYGEQIKDLNRTIYVAELNGSTANDLRDQRNLLLDKLSNLVNINYYEDNQNRFYVDINGQPLVAHYSSEEIQLVERTSKLNQEDALKLNDAVWANGSTFNPTGGKITSILNMRDNISGSEKGIPYYMDKLNEFSERLYSELNRIHNAGYGLNGTNGINLFTMNNLSTADYEQYLTTQGLDGGPGLDVTDNVTQGTSDLYSTEENNRIIADNIKNIINNNLGDKARSVQFLSDGRYVLVDRISAKDITISADVENDLNTIAAAASATGLPGNGDNALVMANVRTNTFMYTWGSPDDFVKSLVSNLGVDTAEARRMSDGQDALLQQIETSRQSIMGVSLDEEMAEMVRFQHAYNANARMITTIDGILDTIINRLGLVGR